MHIQEPAWGQMHQIGWGWWLLMSIGAATIIVLATYAAILFLISVSATRRERDGRDAGGRRGKLWHRQPHAPAAT
jgi:heme/copper-type cytochrome/quinol oxidase subunit 2